MPSMTIREVHDKKGRKEFFKVPFEVYKNDPNWVCPLFKDIEAVFSPTGNSFHKHGKIIRWVLSNDAGKPIGRIAAFVNYQKAYSYSKPTGGIGFFEVINNYEAAKILFQTAEAWLKQQGMEAMDGPINFGENDTFWGLLIEGFSRPSYGINYNPSYYVDFFKAYGFQKLYEQITNSLDITKPFPERFSKIAAWVRKKPDYHFRHFKANALEQFAADFIEIYNDAWKHFENFVPISKTTVIETFNKLKLVMDEKLIWFAYVNDEPASFIVILPDANQMIKPLRGKLNLVNKLRFLYYRWKGATRLRVMVMGTKEKYQNHGIESALFIKIKEYVIPLKQYRELELSWAAEFNNKVLAIHHATGATLSKKHATLRKVF